MVKKKEKIIVLLTCPHCKNVNEFEADNNKGDLKCKEAVCWNCKKSWKLENVKYSRLTITSRGQKTGV